MPSYAVLGATGATGRSLVQILRQSPDRQINAYVRSKQKLLKLVPDVASDPRFHIFEGSLQDTSVLRDCMADTRAVFLAVAVSANVPGCSVAQDTAKAVISALKQLRTQQPNAKMPRLVVLSSSCINEDLFRHVPPAAQWFVKRANSHVYEDLTKAELLLRAESDWLSMTFIKPGGLVQDAQKGHELSTERGQTFLSFLDLAAGMVEVADEVGDKWDMKDVAVLPTAQDVKPEWWIPVIMVMGLTFHFFPWAYPYMKSLGLTT